MVLMDELLFSGSFKTGGASFFCWETLRIFYGVDVACTNFWLNGKNICKENDGFREMVNKLLAILFIHESTLEALQILMHHTLGHQIRFCEKNAKSHIQFQSNTSKHHFANEILGTL